MERRLQAELELLKTDLMVVSKKLESKSQAVSILFESMEKFRTERDEFQRMAEQVMSRYQLLRRALSHGVEIDDPSYSDLVNLGSKQLASLLIESREANKQLQEELCQLRQKLAEAHGDMELLRKQFNSVSPKCRNGTKQSVNNTEKQQLVFHMERLTEQVTELQHELARCSDDRNELIIERDMYRNKCDRLNNELNYILSGDQGKVIDMDFLISEKKSLMNRLQALEEEKMLAVATLSKYQKMLDRKSPTSTNSGSPSRNSSNHEEHCVPEN